MAWLSIVAACVAFVLVLVLPGFGLLQLLKQRIPSASASLLVAMSVSVALISGLGTLALLMGVFAPAVLLAPLIAQLTGLGASLGVAGRLESTPLARFGMMAWGELKPVASVR